MRPLMLGTEIDGFVADRLLEALWREALWLVNDGVATAEQIDDAIRFGAGLRWSFMGTFLVYRIAGGEAGMRHFMAQFGPALKWPWTKLMDVPELTDELLERIVAQSDAQAGGADDPRAGSAARRLPGRRDPGTAQRRLRRRRGARRATRRQLFDRAPAPAVDAGSPTEPLRTHETRVPADWVDYNGHTNDSRYAQLSCDASDAFLRLIGMDAEYLAQRAQLVHGREPHHLRRPVDGPAIRSTSRRRCSPTTRSACTCSTGCTAPPRRRTRRAHRHRRAHVPPRRHRGRAGRAGSAGDGRPDRAIGDPHAALDRPTQAGRFVGAPRS